MQQEWLFLFAPIVLVAAGTTVVQRYQLWCKLTAASKAVCDALDSETKKMESETDKLESENKKRIQEIIATKIIRKNECQSCGVLGRNFCPRCGKALLKLPLS